MVQRLEHSLPSMWPGFDSRSRCHLWGGLSFLLVLVLTLKEDFSPGSSVSFPPQKPTFPNSIWNQWTNSHFAEMPLQIPIYF